MPDSVKTDSVPVMLELCIYFFQSEAFMIEFSVKITALPQNTGNQLSHIHRAVRKTFHRTISSQTSFLIFFFFFFFFFLQFLPLWSSHQVRLPPAAWGLLEALIHTGNKRANSLSPGSLFCSLLSRRPRCLDDPVRDDEVASEGRSRSSFRGQLDIRFQAVFFY